MQSVLTLFLGLALAAVALAENVVPVSLATAGPGNLSHLPAELMTRIGADRAEGLKVSLRFFGGGPLAYQDMLDKNSDFAIAGAPALADLRVKGAPVVSVATVNRVPTFTLLVRQDLKGKIRHTTDLKGRIIGINTSSRASRSTSQQLAEFVVRRAGIESDQVHFVPVGQSLEQQRAALISGSVDALMGDQPFVGQIAREGLGFVLLDFHDPDTTRRVLGGLFLNAQLATRLDILTDRPDLVRRMVRALARTLQWIDTHTPEAIARHMHPNDAAAQRLLTRLLTRYKTIYSPDGAFSEEQIATAEAFWRANRPDDAVARAFRFRDMIDTRFAGERKP
jgi:NitT/TauT family transport system substrate-binding protein